MSVHLNTPPSTPVPATSATIRSPIASDGVAAGDGALTTCRIRLSASTRAQSGNLARAMPLRPTAHHAIDDADIAPLVAVLESDWLTTEQAMGLSSTVASWRLPVFSSGGRLGLKAF